MRSLCPLCIVLLVSVATGAAVRARDVKASAGARPVTIEALAPAPPPEWALLQRHLIDKLAPAALEFVRKYTRPDGTLIWRDEWPGMDGSDDGYESFHNFPLYYALGGPDVMHEVSHKLWDAVTRQFTAYGQVYREFDGYYDWMHHGESSVYFYFFGLADPTVPSFRERSVRFAELYTGDDPEAKNWDPDRKLIRSPINGSRGPRFLNTAEDWSTHRPVLAHYPLPFDDVPGVTSSEAWIDDEQFPALLEAINRRMMRGDVPLNLTATSLVLNAYMVTGEEKYRRWVIDYVTAWIERARRNGGIIPDNVGLDDVIGQYMDGAWWGGYYGWKWPHGLFNILESTTIGASNALLATGDLSWLELPRSQIDVVAARGRVETDGVLLVPHRHDRRGWYDYRRMSPQCPIVLWYLSRLDDDWSRLERVADVEAFQRATYSKHKGDSGNEAGWLAFLAGHNPDYPVQILRATWQETLRRLEVIRADRSTPPEQDVHHWQQRNPVIVEGLVQLMLGGPNHIYHGGLLHCRLRYFDPARRRPGVPPDVAALVHRVTDDGVAVTLVNVHPSASRDVVIQAGAFGEHEFTSVDHDRTSTVVNSKAFTVRLGPATVADFEIGMRRFVNRPRYGAPWE